jgi:FkbM family methyltransferase
MARGPTLFQPLKKINLDMKTPLLFLIFNRPEPTKRVFEEIRKARPSKLFVAADGPRPDRREDIEKCQQTRDIINNIDWPCEVKTLFQEKNLGCKIGATTGISWFFDQVEEGIVLEDDCLPHPSFFPFCEEMLAHFRHEEKIIMIDGYNIAGSSHIPYSYTYSRYGHLWGWASWRRVWKQYDVTMKIWDKPENRKKIRKAMNDRYQWNYREWLYNETYHGRKDTWDYQWESYRLFHGQLSVIPATNMIENLGFGADATHTKQLTSHLIIPGQEITFPLVHNPHIIPDDSYDRLLRPEVPATSMKMRKIKSTLKKLGKDLLPPLAYKVAKGLIRGKKTFQPRWNTLQYPPLKGLQLFFDPSGSWQSRMIEGSYDTFMFDRLKSLQVTGKTIYDIGAHIGYHSFYFARLVGPTGNVHTFEPHPKNVERIKAILENNPDIKKIIHVHEVAISDQVGTVDFTMHADIEGGRSSGNFIDKADTFWKKDVYEEKGFIHAQVPTVSIDEFVTRHGIQNLPDIIKLDIEGAEYLALQGAKHTLLTKKPRLFIEIHSMHNMFLVCTLLSSLSYHMRIAHIDTNGVCYIEAWADPKA